MNGINKIIIAVLPLENRNQDMVYLSDGISDAIISKLAAIPELRVTSRRSSFRFRNPEMKMKKISEELGSEIIIDGSVRILGNKIKVLVNVIVPKQDEVIWSGSWENNLENFFELENNITESVAENIRDSYKHFDLHDNKEKVQSQIDIDTYKLFLKANHLQFNWVVSDSLEAVSLYDQVIERAPNFYDPYICKIDSYSFLRAKMAIDPKVADSETTRIINLLDKAGVKNEDLNLAKAGYHFWGTWNFKAAFEELRNALELNPSHSGAHELLGLMYAFSNKTTLAIQHFSHSINLDPLSANKHISKAWGLYTLKKFEDALESYEEAIRLNPKLEDSGGYSIKIKSLIALGQDLDELYHTISEKQNIAQVEKEGLLGLVAANSTDKDAIEHHVSNLLRVYEINRNEQVPGLLMQIYNRTGDTSKAIMWLKRSFEKRNPMLVGLIMDPLLNSLQKHPEYIRVKKHLLILNEEEIKESQNGNTPSEEWTEFNKTRLINLFNDEKPYLTAAITLQDIANSLDISRNSLSWLINAQFNKNFNDFVNHYRIEEFKRKVIDPLNHLSILGLAYECGFNSKTSFNTIFKRVTGMTPKEFRKLNIK